MYEERFKAIKAAKLVARNKQIESGRSFAFKRDKSVLKATKVAKDGQFDPLKGGYAYEERPHLSTRRNFR